jgi:spectinomycin phosphotransferase
MIEKSSLSEQRIVDCLKINYGIEATALFLKLKRGHQNNNSSIIIELLRNAGIQHIIPMVKTIRGEAAQCMDDFTLTVFPFVDGQDGRGIKEGCSFWYLLFFIKALK